MRSVDTIERNDIRGRLTNQACQAYLSLRLPDGLRKSSSRDGNATSELARAGK